MKKNSVRESNYVLRSLRDEVDYKMGLVYSSILNLNYNVAIKGLLQSPDNHKDIIQLLTAKDGIGHLEQEQDTIYVYLPDGEILLSSRGVYSQMEMLYGEIFSYGDMAYEEFHDTILNGNSQTALLPNTKVKTNSRESEAILYLAKIPFGFESGASAKVLFFIDSSQIFQQVESYVRESNSWFGIYTREQELIYHTDNCPADIEAFMGEYKRSGFQNRLGTAGYETGGNIYTMASSNFNGWLFISGIAKKDLYAQVYRIQFTVLLLFFIYAVVGCYLSYSIARRNLKPLHRILAMSKSAGISGSGQINEYQMLESNFQELMESNSLYLEKMKNTWRQNLVSGRYNTIEEIEELELPEITGFSYFLVMIIDFSAPVLVMEEQSIDQVNRQRYIVRSGIKELGLKQAIVTDISIEQLGILFCSGEASGLKDPQMEEKRRLILTYVKKAAGESICLGQGEVVKGPLLIGYSFIQAKCAVRACLEFHKDYMDYASIPRKNEKYYFPDQLREMLFDAVRKGNLKQAKSILKVLKVENFETRQLSDHQSGQFLEEMHSVLLHLKNEDFISDEELSPVDTMSGQDKYYYYVQKLFAACMQKTEQAFTQKKKIEKEFLSFIDEHYMDSNLCLSMAASHFQLSDSYLSYLFKKTYGVNFSTYLENKRIEEARLLILNGEHSLEEIGYLVGYNSSHVFRRAFRKVTGHNPSEFMKLK